MESSQGKEEEKDLYSSACKKPKLSSSSCLTIDPDPGVWNVKKDEELIPERNDLVPTIEDIHEKDLPLLSNTNQVHISHYLMNLKFTFSTQTVHGVLIIFPEVVGPSSKKQPQQDVEDNLLNEENNDEDCYYPSEIVLDCCSLKVQSVSSLKGFQLKDLSKNPIDLYNQLQERRADEEESLKFVVDKWSLSICGYSRFPTAIKIVYQTYSSTPSLHWRPSKGIHNMTNKDEYSSSSSKDTDTKNDIICTVFTPASPVNNRGIFPCQEPPEAMATWQCYLQLDNPYVGFLSSDKIGEIITKTSEYTVSYFNCSEILPMSTFAIFVTSPSKIIDIVTHGEIQIPVDDDEIKTKFSMSISADGVELGIQNVRLIFQNEMDFDITSLSTYLIHLLVQSRQILGNHPFQKLDLIVMPPAFPTLGLCNPNMIFLSPSLFYGETSSPLIYPRLAHELSHFWFGLSIGALDWCEEWLSEGFATFAEDILHRRVLEELLRKCDDKELDRKMRIKTSLNELKLMPCHRLITLQNELENTAESHGELQILCPNTIINNNNQNSDCDEMGGKSNHHESSNTASSCTGPSSSSTSSSSTSNLPACKNGLEPMQTLLQVHYLKGYFFLHHLSNLVSQEKFLIFLKQYVYQFRGQLVTSDDFLDYFKRTFCQNENSLSSTISELDIDLLSKVWLQESKLPQPYYNVNLDVPHFILPENIQRLFPHHIEELMNINHLMLSFNTFSSDMSTTQGLINNTDDKNSIVLNATEKLLLLEQILSFRHNGHEYLCKDKCFISYLEKLIEPNQSNPEIQHRWCELIIKFTWKEKVEIVENFLCRHPAMGVFLYGEMMITEKLSFQKLARKLYRKLKDILDPPFVQVLKKMIF